MPDKGRANAAALRCCQGAGRAQIALALAPARRRGSRPCRFPVTVRSSPPGSTPFRAESPGIPGPLRQIMLKARPDFGRSAPQSAGRGVGRRRPEGLCVPASTHRGTIHDSSPLGDRRRGRAIDRLWHRDHAGAAGLRCGLGPHAGNLGGGARRRLGLSPPPVHHHRHCRRRDPRRWPSSSSASTPRSGS